MAEATLTIPAARNWTSEGFGSTQPDISNDGTNAVNPPKMAASGPYSGRATISFVPRLNPITHLGKPGAIGGVLVCPCLGLDIFHVAGQRVGVDRTIVDFRLASLHVQPGQGVLHPVLVVAGREILAGMGAA
jgi:hypothetical protein